MKKSNERKLKVEWTILKESEKEKLAFEKLLAYSTLLVYSIIVCIESIIDWNEWNW